MPPYGESNEGAMLADFQKLNVPSPWHLTARQFSTLYHTHSSSNPKSNYDNQYQHRLDFWHLLNKSVPITTTHHGPVHYIGPMRFIRDSLDEEQLEISNDSESSGEDWRSHSFDSSSSCSIVEDSELWLAEAHQELEQKTAALEAKREAFQSEKMKFETLKIQQQNREKAYELRLKNRVTDLNAQKAAIRKVKKQLDVRSAMLDTRASQLEKQRSAQNTAFRTRVAKELEKQQQDRAKAERTYPTFTGADQRPWPEILLNEERYTRLKDLSSYMKILRENRYKDGFTELKRICEENIDDSFDWDTFRGYLEAAEKCLGEKAVVPAMRWLGEAVGLVVDCLPEFEEEVEFEVGKDPVGGTEKDKRGEM